MDEEFSRLCDNQGIRYSRYADDMFFSSDNEQVIRNLRNKAVRVLLTNGFRENREKTKYFNYYGRVVINGITIHKPGSVEFQLKASGKMKRMVRSAIFRMIITGDYSSKPRVLGTIHYIEYIERGNKYTSDSPTYIEKTKEYIKKISKKISHIQKLVDLYNENPFFKDQVKLHSIEIDDDEDYGYMMTERMDFLEKRHLRDVAQL